MQATEQKVEPVNQVRPEYISQVCTYVHHLRIACVAFNATCCQLSKNFLPPDLGPYYKTEPPPNILKNLAGVLMNTLDNIVEFARTHFSIGDEHITVTVDDIPETLRPSGELMLEWDPSKVWEFLRVRFNPEAVQRRHFREAADLFVKEFSLDYNEPKETKNTTRFDVHAYIDGSHFDWKKVYRYSYHAHTAIRNLRRAIAIWSEAITLDRLPTTLIEEGMQCLASWGNPNEVDLGAKVALAQGLWLIPRKTRIEVHVTPDLAAHLNTFIGMHRTPPRSDQ